MLFLIAHDEQSGRSSGTLAVDNGYAGALLLDLAAETLLDADGKHLVARPGAASHPPLGAAHSAVTASAEPRTARARVGRLPGGLRPLGPRIGQSLAERGVLAEERRTILGIFPSTTWPETDPAPERELRGRLTSVLVDGSAPDPRTALLLSLLSFLGVVRGPVGKEHRKVAESRAKEIAEASADGAAVSSAVSHSVQAVQAAIMVAVIIPVISTTTS